MWMLNNSQRFIITGLSQAVADSYYAVVVQLVRLPNVSLYLLPPPPLVCCFTWGQSVFQIEAKRRQGGLIWQKLPITPRQTRCLLLLLLLLLLLCVGLDHQSHFSFHFLTIKANENTADLGRELFMSTVVFALWAVGFDATNFTRAPVKTQKWWIRAGGGKKMMRDAKGNEFAVSSCTGKYTRCVYLSAILGDIASPVGCGPLSPTQRMASHGYAIKVDPVSLYYISIIVAAKCWGIITRRNDDDDDGGGWTTAFAPPFSCSARIYRLLYYKIDGQQQLWDDVQNLYLSLSLSLMLSSSWRTALALLAKT